MAAAMVALLVWATFELLNRQVQDVRFIQTHQQAFVESVRATDPACADVLEKLSTGVRLSIHQAARDPCGRDHSQHWFDFEFKSK